MDKKFQFHMPIDLVKADDSEDEWKVSGIASTGDEDLQGEKVLQDGVDISMLKAGRGLFNWDHQKGPENVLGQIEDAEFVDQDGKKCLMVKGYLFKAQPRAQAFYNILKSVKKSNGPRVHLSIEGKILERDIHNPRSIKKARIDKVALTLDPVNPYTYAQLVKSLNGAEEAPEPVETVEIEKTELEILVDIAEKAMMAGAPVGPPGSRVGGEAMSQEDLESRVKKVTYSKKHKKNKKEMIKSVIESIRKAYPNHDPLELTEWVIEAFLAKSSEGE